MQLAASNSASTLPQALRFVIHPIFSTISHIMQPVTEILAAKITKALENLELPAALIKLEHPTELSFGDYSSNVAMAIAKQAGKNPLELATLIAEEINKDLGEWVERVSALKPGFVNFYLTKDFFVANTTLINTKADDFGKSDALRGKRVLIEFTDPNPFKQFHIGHLMSNAIGESISRIIEFSGANVIRANYQGDVGLHVAKCIWGINNKDSEYLFDQSVTSEAKIKFLGDCYVSGNTAYEDDTTAKGEIVTINKQVYERSDEKVNALYDSGRKISLEHFETIYKKLGSKFDHYFFESQTWKMGRDLVMAHLSDGTFEKSNGAIIFLGEKYGLHTRVFINSEGVTTYESKDLGLFQLKIDTVKDFDQSIVITALEQKEYFKVVNKAFEEICPDLAVKTTHISHGFLKLTSGKMSSRLGNVITGESLLNSTEELAMEKISDRGLNESDKKTIAEAVAVGAIKYTILRGSPGKDIIFDPEKSISFEGDAGPYLQYSYTRALSVLEKARAEKLKPEPSQHDNSIYDLEKILYRFPEVVATSYHELAPSYIVTYLTELAGSFNSFYAQNKIIDPENPESSYRLALCESFSIVMKSGLSLLGIKVLERM